MAVLVGQESAALASVDRTQSDKRDVRRPLFLGAVAALPLLIGAIADAAHGWVPIWDWANSLIRARDVFSLHPPLIGQYTQAGHYIGHPVFTPGPMMYWLFAPPTLVMQWWPAAPLIWSALFQTAMVVAIVWLADRIGGAPLSVLTVLGIFALYIPAGPREIYTVWNPYVAILPLLLLAFVTARILQGDLKLLWLAALLATFVVQSYLTLAAPALLLAGMVAVACAVAAIRSWRSRGAVPWPDGLRPRRLATTGALLFVCWLPPVVQQLKDNPGNLGSLWAAARARPTNMHPGYTFHDNLAHVQRVPRAGFGSALTTLAQLVWVWPRRLLHRQAAFKAFMVGPFGTQAKIFGVLTLAVMVAVVAVAIWRRQRGLAAVGGASLALLVGAVFTAAAVPTGPLAIENVWGVVWVDIAAMLSWVTVVWAMWCVVRALVRAHLADRIGVISRRSGAIAVSACGAVLLGAALLVATAGQPKDRSAWAYPVVRRATAAVMRQGVRGPHQVVVMDPDPMASTVAPGVLLALRARSVPVGAWGGYASSLGPRYQMPPGTPVIEMNLVHRPLQVASKPGWHEILAMPVKEMGPRAMAAVTIHPDR